jgi:aspartyl-tRNA(Asn)/glutamyl-tRNA(Gln) amidotransferase subunit B
MQEGSLRVDANINLHIETPAGKVATPIVEVKNMNSFRAVERALDYEAPRQYREWQETGRVLGQAPKQTRGWDDAAGITRAQRSKEESSDYRYFPDPDLVPVSFQPAEIAAAKASLGELPAALRGRLEADYDLSAYDTDVIVNQGRPVVSYFIAVADACGDGKAASNWVTQDVLRVLKEKGISIDELPVASAALADLVVRIKSGEVPGPRAREVFQMMADSAATVDDALAKLGIERVDDAELVALCEGLVAENPRIAADVRGGKLQAVGALVGQAKKRNPNVDPNRIRELCIQLIQSSA